MVGRGELQPGYLPKDVVELTGVPYSTLNLWAKQGFIRPSVREANGTGSARIYSESDLAELRIAMVLRRAGISTPLIIQAMEKFRRYPGSKRVEILVCREPEIYISIRRPA